MTPTFRWVFLLALALALVGRAMSVPEPLTYDACALLCNPGAETESEQERDPIYFPRYPKVNCKLQSHSDNHQAYAIVSHCLKLCSYDLTISSEVNCFALRSSLEANLGCYCEALTPLSPNTMRLHETWRLNMLVKELAKDVLNVILNSSLDVIILCELHRELFKDVNLTEGLLMEKCKRHPFQSNERKKRSVEESEMDLSNNKKVSHADQLQLDDYDVEINTSDESVDSILIEKVRRQIDDSFTESELKKSFVAEDLPSDEVDAPLDQQSETKQLCNSNPGNNKCHCNEPDLDTC